MSRFTANPRRTRRAIAVAALGAGLLLAGPFAAKSSAGTYNATECASWNPTSIAQYIESGHHMLGASRDCGGGGAGLGIALPQAYWSAFGSLARYQVDAPPGTHFTHISLNQKGANADGWSQNLLACSVAGCVDMYPLATGAWQGRSTFGNGFYTTWLAGLYCVNGSGCYGSPQAGMFVKDVSLELSDDALPSVAEGGELLNGEIQRGVGRIDVTPADVGGGLTSAWLVVNGLQVDRQSYSCTALSLRPCPASGGTLRLEVDTQGSPFHDGQNLVQACAADVGDPPNVNCTSERALNVDNSCTASKVPGGTDLSAIFARNKKDSVKVKAGQGALLTGQLTDNSGDPVSGATLCVSEGVAGSTPNDVGTVKTNPDGRYRYGVSPGPNRSLTVGYRYNRKQLDRDARFFSNSRPKLRLAPKRKTRNGEALLLYGSIPGPSNDGRVVILQAGYPHSKQWKTFTKAKTDANGDYKARYRFTSTFVTTQYRMRSVVPEQNGYPYRGGASRAKGITVLGQRR
jgi:5-hydroxyisourate hydrolase-like protein (transthyretin family)